MQPIYILAAMTILHIDTSTSICSAAITQNGMLFAHRSDASGQNHARMLPIFVEELLAELYAQDLRLDAVALSQGPGSYTGLRIGTATAKGLCYGLNIPLIAIDTLRVLVDGVKEEIVPEAWFCPMIDARRMEVYCAFFDAAGDRLTDVEAKIIDEHSFEEVLAERPVYFLGDGAAKCKDVIKHPNAHFIDGIVPLAANMGKAAEQAFAAKQFVDVAYFDPFYLKEYQAIVSKNKIF